MLNSIYLINGVYAYISFCRNLYNLQAMNKKCLYTGHALKYFRIIAVVCFVILLPVTIYRIFQLSPSHGNTADLAHQLNIIVNVVSLVSLSLIMISPRKFDFASILAFCYSVFLIVFKPANNTGIMMFFLGTAFLLARGIIRKHLKIWLLMLTFILTALITTKLRFGLYPFLQYLKNDIGTIAALSFLTFFIRSYERNNIVSDNKVLNIALYKDLTQRDCQTLKMIQQDLKYKAIAEEENITEGTLKNRLHFIFNTLETDDKQGFLSLYGDYEIVFQISAGDSKQS